MSTSINIVLIADRVAEHSELTIDCDTLEYAQEPYFTDLSNAIRDSGFTLTCYTHPRELISNISKHSADVVLSVWSGRRSRNRKALVSSICEAYGLPYIGADCYTQIVCQDKCLAKRHCEKFGLVSPQSILIERESDCDLVETLSPPFVVKPNHEGGSIGIGRQNLVGDPKFAIQLAMDLLGVHRQPILVEEFISGEEVSIVLLGRGERVDQAIPVRMVFADNDLKLEETIYSLEFKKDPSYKTKFSLSKSLDCSVIEAAKQLFLSFDKVDLLRVDGRVCSKTGQFHVIELTPDVFLGKNCAFSEAMKLSGVDYASCINKVLEIGVAYRSKCQ